MGKEVEKYRPVWKASSAGGLHYYGAWLKAWTFDEMWRCEHRHRTREEALACAMKWKPGKADG